MIKSVKVQLKLVKAFINIVIMNLAINLLKKKVKGKQNENKFH